jgi:rhodanese-related sulfurtransferase
MVGRVPTVSAADAAARGVLLVDVREPHEIAEVAVPGALAIPLRTLPGRLAELPRDRTVGFICRSGNRSAGATRAARRAGLDAVNVAGGVLAWARAGLPLTRDGKAVA